MLLDVQFTQIPSTPEGGGLRVEKGKRGKGAEVMRTALLSPFLLFSSAPLK
jgi:hypothetical protein